MSALTLKIIALVTMLWDHITAVFPVSWSLYMLLQPEEALPWVDVLDLPLAFIGRVSAPIFLWGIAQGCRHTKNVKRYALRLLAFACLAEWPYYLLFGAHGNVLFTYFFGLLTLKAMDWGNKRRPGLGCALAALSVILSWHFDPFEGGGRYILFILVFYLTDAWSIPKRALLWLLLYPASRWRLLVLTLTEGLRLSSFVLNAFGPLLGVACTLFYNGEKGPDRRGLKYLWYAAYPVHLLLLCLVKLFRGW